MPNVLTDVGKRKVLDVYINSDTFTAHLYKNDFTPGHDSVEGDFAEADFDGYEPKELVDGTVAPVLDPGFRAVATWALLTWLFEGGEPQAIFGWYVTDLAGDLVIAERFYAEFPLDEPGQPMNLAVRFTMRSQFANIPPP